MSIRVLIRWSSGIALSILILALLTTVVLRVRKKAMGQETTPPALIEESEDSATVGVNKGFEYLERVDGRLLFALEALQTMGRKSNWHEIEGVTLKLYEKNGELGPVLTCRRASFNSRTRETRLSGSIHVQFPDGSLLSTETGALADGGQAFQTSTDVIYVGKNLIGTASRAQFLLKASLLVLSKGVFIQSSDGNSMAAPRLEYSKKEGFLRFPEGASIRYGSLRLKAGRGVIQMSEDGEDVKKLHLAGGVRTSFEEIFSGQRVSSDSESLDIVKDAASAWQIDARSTGAWVELSLMGGTTNLLEEIHTWRLKAVYGKEGLLSAKTFGMTCFEIVPYEGSPRRGQAGSAKIWLHQGEITNLELKEHVILQEDEWTVKSVSARMDLSSEKMILQGDPARSSNNFRVRLQSELGQLMADQVVLMKGKEEAELRGRVQGELYKVGLVGMPSGKTGRESGRLNIAGGVLKLTRGGKDYDLREDARAWQGDQLLMADRILYHSEGENLHASGHVRTTFPAILMDPKASAEDDVVLVARSMDFSQVTGIAHYQGQVVFSGPRQMLSAGDLRIEFGEDGHEAREVVATGKVEMKDLSTGQSLQGKQIIRRLGEEMITVHGSPARATDSLGNMLSGRTLTFNEADGSVMVSEETETIYHSEEPNTEPEKP